MSLHCDLFCRVVDNLGDAGVCWRLARQLAMEHGWTVRLWIDDAKPLASLRPGIRPDLPCQTIDGVEIRAWPTASINTIPGDVVIEAFACELPNWFVGAMGARRRPPVWINLEYLSAEDWVTGHHGLPSPHPERALTKYFFFPGFVAGTGGLIREKKLPEPLTRSLGRELVVSLFCYGNPVLPDLLDTWAAGPEPIACRVTDGLAREQVADWLGIPFTASTRASRGKLTLEALPFIPQENYDRLLADSDLNFVRGEDSFVRAQWAARPFVWHAYPQDEEVHFLKLDAFSTLYCHGMRLEAAEAVRRFWWAWNGRGRIVQAWPGFRAVLAELAAHGPYWRTTIATHGDLAQNLVRFCKERI
jgi:uncharacterized repeat protein (TIGR03837 family)